MIYINKSKFHNLTSLYGFFNEKNMTILDTSEDPLDIKKIKNKNDIFFIIDPTIKELKLLKDLEKEVIVMLTYAHEDYLQSLKSPFIKQVLIIDDLDELMFRKRDFKKYIHVSPVDLNDSLIKSKDFAELTHSCVAYDDLDKFSDEDIDILKSIPNYNFKTIYSGFKVIKKKSDFKKLMKINNSDVSFKNFPIFDPLREINLILFTASFPKKEFPIVPAITAANKNIPLVFSQRYYSWILTNLQNPNKNFMEELLDFDFRLDVRKEQFNLFVNHFKDRPTIKDVLSKYYETN